MKDVRIGTVEYLNTTPLIAGLEKMAGLSLVSAVPSRIIDLLLSDAVDIGLVSLIDIARSKEPLVALPVGMIGCDGPTMTVRIFSKVPLESVTTLHADTDSHTSVALARVLLHRLHGLSPEIVDFHAREHPFDAEHSQDLDPETVLMIGDKVVTASPPAVRYPYQLDLGDAWHTMTGLPFVYAIWACKRGRAEDPSIIAAASALDRNRRRNKTRADQIINKSAKKHRWPVDLAKEYAGTLLRFDLDERAQAAIGVFLTMCREIGVLEADRADPEIRKFVTTPG